MKVRLFAALGFTLLAANAVVYFARREVAKAVASIVKQPVPERPFPSHPVQVAHSVVAYREEEKVSREVPDGVVSTTSAFRPSRESQVADLSRKVAELKQMTASVQPSSGAKLDRNARLRLNAIHVLDKRYGTWFDAKELDSAVRENVVTILADDSDGRREIRRKHMPEAEETKALAEHRKAIATRLNDAIGPDRAAELKEYMYALPLVSLAQDTAARSEAIGIKMSATEIGNFARILSKMPIGICPTPVTAEEYRVLTMNDAQAIKAASAILKPEQMPIFKQALAERMKIK
jgi:hypothetical protein